MLHALGAMQECASVHVHLSSANRARGLEASGARLDEESGFAA